MPGTFSPLPRVSNHDMHHGTCVTHMSWCMPGSLLNGFLWSRWQGKRPRHSRTCATCNFTYLVRGQMHTHSILRRWVIRCGNLGNTFRYPEPWGPEVTSLENTHKNVLWKRMELHHYSSLELHSVAEINSNQLKAVTCCICWVNIMFHDDMVAWIDQA